MKLFIAGCGRSGTTLIRDLMNCYEDTFVLVEGPYGESPFTHFESLDRLEKNLVIKRIGDSWKTLASLPDDVELIYCVRHPFDTLTSTHPLTSHLRQFHITTERWMSEYKALRALRIAQPNRKIFFLRYEDLVKAPDLTQGKISEHFGLIQKYPFTRNPANIEVFTDSVEKWHNNLKFQSYLQNISDACKILIEEFGNEFDYSLPKNYASTLERKTFEYRFSIIIPLEFHRGQIENCLRGWTNEQKYPQDQYEILAAGCRSSLGEDAISYIKSELRPQDRLLIYNEAHDISLCAHAAHEAKGEILIFTESHCLPKPNVLSITEEKMRAHPEWAGFSGSGLPITHNRLSVIEADMYESDIRYGMTEHPWRKILDQYFAVRYREYLNAGGFNPKLGHFSEWYLAACMHKKEYYIGYAPDVQFWHYYSGDFQELLEFTNDFTRGEMKYKSEFLDDSCQDYFPIPNEWVFRFSWFSDLAAKAYTLAWKAYSRSIPAILNPIELMVRIRLILTWYMHAYHGIKPAIAWADFRHKTFLRLLLFGDFLKIGKTPLKKIFLHLIYATIRLERIRFIQNWLENFANQGSENTWTPTASIMWKPETPYDSFVSTGIYPLEERDGTKFRWSEPVAIVELPLQLGSYDLIMEWLPIRPIRNLTVYLNEKPLALSQIDQQVTGTFIVTSNQPVRLSWTCEPWTKPKNDPRLFGVPIKSISCRAHE